MLPESLEVIIIWLDLHLIGRRCLRHLEGEGGCPLVLFACLVVIDMADGVGCSVLALWLCEDGYCQITSNDPGDVGMGVPWRLVLRPIRVLVEGMTSVEEFADVSSNSVLCQERASWMISNILPNFQNKIIEDAKLLPALDSLLELLDGHCFATQAGLGLELDLRTISLEPIPYFQASEYYKHKNEICRAHPSKSLSCAA